MHIASIWSNLAIEKGTVSAQRATIDIRTNANTTADADADADADTPCDP